MAEITLKGAPVHTVGALPPVGSVAPDATLTGTDLADVSLSSIAGKKVLNIFPSLDTATCATSVRTFARKAAGRAGVTVLNISADLPFAHKRFCTAEGIEGVVNLSTFRSDFATAYGLALADSRMKGLCSRVVLVLDEKNTVLHAEQVKEIAQEPDYDAALGVL